MLCITKYDINVDIAEVDQFGFVDLRDSLKNGYVPAGNAESALDYNEIEDLDSICGKPRDVFEALDYGIKFITVR